jgi:antitoxin (DNA-binding transcriptional repressor) of toxin-antitoxin stability system
VLTSNDKGNIAEAAIALEAIKLGKMRSTVSCACAETFLIPIEVVAGKRQVHLRLEPPRNGQRACINLAGDYQLGAIAQLGERSAGSRKVGGSSPPSSTATGGHEVVVGAHRFRNHFGHWMERAAGDEILITRRGRRYARLGPPNPQLATTDTAPDPAPAADPAASPPGKARTSR